MTDISQQDMYDYGYTWEGMIPISKEQALELFDQDNEVFRLYEDGSEGLVVAREEIEKFKGMFGMESTTLEGIPRHGVSYIFTKA